MDEVGTFDRDDAVLIAASEALPADDRDLSLLLERLAERQIPLRDCLAGECGGDSLGAFVAGAITPARVQQWHDRLDRLSHDRPSVWLVTVTDPRYPDNLRAAYDRPPFLFVDGTLADADRRALAIVGSRTTTPAAEQAAYDLGAAAAREGVTVVSGLARGIDAAAHRGALDAGGRTIAVFGTGIDLVYPPEHAELASDIAAQGAVVSQFRPGTPGTKSTFPLRNAVISGLSLGSVLMDATATSGTRSEGEAAVRQDRRVLLWQPELGGEPWAEGWVASGQVGWARSAGEALAPVTAP